MFEMNKEEAVKATKHGAVAACISGVLTLLVLVFAVFTKGENGLEYWNDPIILFDIFLIFTFALFIYKKSRAAAVLMLIYFIASKVIIGFETGKFTGSLIALVFVYYFSRAVQGAFVFHKIEKTENPEYRKSRKWIWLLISPIIAIVLFFIGLGVLETTGLVPSIEVQAGSDVPEPQIAKLVSEGIISDTDEIEYFYSEGLISVMGGGNILTNNKVISYTKNEDGELEVYSINLADVKSIEIIESGDYLTDAIYKISESDPEIWLTVWLSTENDGHLKFLNALKDKTTEKAQE